MNPGFGVDPYPASTCGSDVAEDAFRSASFEIRGVLAGREVVATWVDGRLVADAALLTMAQHVVDAGETSVTPSGTVVEASLETFVGAVIAISRALDHLDDATVHMGLDR